MMIHGEVKKVCFQHEDEEFNDPYTYRNPDITPERKWILDDLKINGMSRPNQIAKRIGMRVDCTSKLLIRLCKKGYVKTVKYGYWVLT